MGIESPVPLWRQTLRGFSRCAFQANEIAAAYHGRTAAFHVIAVLASGASAHVPRVLQRFAHRVEDAPRPDARLTAGRTASLPTHSYR